MRSSSFRLGNFTDKISGERAQAYELAPATALVPATKRDNRCYVKLRSNLRGGSNDRLFIVDADENGHVNKARTRHRHRRRLAPADNPARPV